MLKNYIPPTYKFEHIARRLEATSVDWQPIRELVQTTLSHQVRALRLVESMSVHIIPQTAVGKLQPVTYQQLKALEVAMPRSARKSLYNLQTDSFVYVPQSRLGGKLGLKLTQSPDLLQEHTSLAELLQPYGLAEVTPPQEGQFILGVGQIALNHHVSGRAIAAELTKGKPYSVGLQKVDPKTRVHEYVVYREVTSE